MDKILSDDDLADFYNNYNSNRNLDNPDKNIKRDKMYKLDYESIISIVPEKGSFLDVGCGSGDFLNCFSNVRKIGYDIDQNAITSGTKMYPDIEFIDCLDHVDNDEIDCIIFRGSFQYMRDINQSIKYCYDKLKKNGFLCIASLPNTDSPLAILQRENWVICNKLEHIILFNISSVNYLLNHKFKILNITYPYFGTPYENHNKDLQLFIDLIREKKGARMKQFAFWGSIMNVITQKL